MYDKNDPRALLATQAAAKPKVFTSYTPSDYLRFYEDPPQQSDERARGWIGRGGAAVIVYSETKAGATFARRGQADEWVILLPDAASGAQLTIAGRAHDLAGYSITFVPPGDSVLTMPDGGRVVRMFTSAHASDLAGQASNAAGHRDPNPNLSAYAPWPVPTSGYKVRSYSLDVPDVPGRFGRIWRCTTFMVNLFAPQRGPRDVTKLSPHHHDEFEQYSLALEGSFMHHLRWPWTPNMKMWRGDENEFCSTPSLAVIPPPAIHTSRGLAPGANLLVDIFAPPRLDFSNIAGWVLNADDYPMP